MTQITKETKEEISRRFPQFVEATQAFYAKELPPAKYKGTSGKFGCYGERGPIAPCCACAFPAVPSNRHTSLS